MIFKEGRYSGFIKPITYLFDLIVITSMLLNSTLYVKNQYQFLSYLLFSWVIISVVNKFYHIKRIANLVQITSSLFRQFFSFTIVVYAYLGYFKQYYVSRPELFRVFFKMFLIIALFKIVTYFLLIKYREYIGGNYRNVIIIGENESVKQLKHIFKTKKEFGYSFKKNFNTKSSNFSLKTCFNYIKENDIDEVYCSISELTDTEMSKIINFADKNLKIVKFIPDVKKIFTKKLLFEYYDYLPVLSLRKNPLEDPVNKVLKRILDIIVSSLVIILVMSWLTPIIGFLIKRESKGDIFFKQKRSGINNNHFMCYKFRSMKKNDMADLVQMTKGDMRVTKIGKFIRKTSIDELPQFFNVLLGDMSVVGPRPHMVSHTKMYADSVDRFMVRHFVKPGITGMAQVKGYRGEIETQRDIVNRVKYDIFYLENWSVLLDIKIVFQTVFNIFKGEEKAY